jgi:gag-polypeptide of LTR copia-type
MSSGMTSLTGRNIEKLTDKNYRSRAQQMHWILAKNGLQEVVNSTPPTPEKPTAESTTTAEMATDTAEPARKRNKATALIESSVSSTVLVYLEGEDNPSKMWMILKDLYAPRTEVTSQRILRRFITLQMKDDDLQAHQNYVQSLKRELEEGMKVPDGLYKTVLLGSIGPAYAITVNILQSQETLTPTTMIINGLLEENRKLTEYVGRSERSRCRG